MKVLDLVLAAVVSANNVITIEHDVTTYAGPYKVILQEFELITETSPEPAVTKPTATSTKAPQTTNTTHDSSNPTTTYARDHIVGTTYHRPIYEDHGVCFAMMNNFFGWDFLGVTTRIIPCPSSTLAPTSTQT